ncbi:Sas10/Utp3/C1D family [Nesidiocoris tenuis]|uniref:Sas10/Utp3/C1D family n=1 Tax=Nesidiocoris tenuis TaxID=355587 RepID=A0ABN7ACW4_9HEMI|nr:Sas10/Utp3/C1D family [Nesidiocoris tenuis]
MKLRRTERLRRNYKVELLSSPSLPLDVLSRNSKPQITWADNIDTKNTDTCVLELCRCDVAFSIPERSYQPYNFSVKNLWGTMEKEIQTVDKMDETKGVKSALSTIASIAKNLTNSVDSLCSELKAKNLKDGISLLTVKKRLLVYYMAYLTEFMKKKVQGEKIEESDVVDKLAEIRVYLERIQPIEKKLKYQIDKMLKVASTGAADKNDPSQFRANPSSMALEPGDEEDNDEDGGEEDASNNKRSAVYIPPKLSAVHYDGDESRAERRRKIIERARKRALQSSVMQELKEEYLDVPVEVKSTNSLKQMEDKYQERKRQYEEDNFTRLPVTKSELKRAKRVSTLGTIGDEITHFEDTSILRGDTSSLDKKRKSKMKAKGRFSKKGTKKFKRR